MKSLPELITERLRLSALTVTDIPLIVRYADNNKVARYTANIPHPYTEKDAVFWLNLANEGLKRNNHFIFALRDKETNAFMGGIGLRQHQQFKRAELGYWLGEPFWGKGLTTEAAGAVIDFGFGKLGLRKITARHIVVNGASGKVLLKNGMQQEGLLRREITRDGQERDVAVYGLLVEDVETFPR
ncbi:GNAT family N-acetyltransferase [Neolewinella persica]|uniref:GNAT family N-acetyltransferase n=1 Tax=Neolewinella persica TaxID=70998 RepID=UPI00039FAFD8|nr:GNAT family protein [Neolewinella persica]